MSLPQTQTPPRSGAAPPRRAARSPLRSAAEILAVLAITLVLIGGLLEVGLRLFAPQIVAPLGGLFVADPATAYRLKPGARVPYRFAEGDTTFAINSQGLREDHAIGPTTPGMTRLLALGDSFAFGMGVDATQAYPHLLNGSHAADGSAVESINAGVFGYGTDNEAAWLRTYGWPLAPQIVMVGFFVGNDVKDVMLGMDKTTVDAQGRLVESASSLQAMARPGATTQPTADAEVGTPAPSGGGIKGWLEAHSHAYIFLHNLYYTLFPDRVRVQKPGIFDAAVFFLKAPPPAIAAGWQKTEGFLDAMRADAQAHGAQLVVVVIPAREQVQNASWQAMEQQFGLSDADVQRDRPQQELAAWSARTGAPLIDLLPGFRGPGAGGGLYFRTDRHWTVAGHALAATLIRAGLVRLGLFAR